jgi:hypothetical protein
VAFSFVQNSEQFARVMTLRRSLVTQANIASLEVQNDHVGHLIINLREDLLEEGEVLPGIRTVCAV